MNATAPKTKTATCPTHGDYLAEIIDLPIAGNPAPFWSGCPACIRDISRHGTHGVTKPHRLRMEETQA